jgi:hypothetical protein
MARWTLVMSGMFVTLGGGGGGVGARGDQGRVADAGTKLDPYALPYYETKYYHLYTDLDRAQVREVIVHVTKMAEVYADRTRGFSGVIRHKFPFIVFKQIDDFRAAAGAPAGTAGVFNGRELIATAGEELDARAWHTIQHEGFHQFAAAVIRGDLPTWVNEGLAEYFGEGLFTGDDIITGVIPEWRRQRIRKTIEAGKFKTVERMMAVSLDDWNREMKVANYDQAWSMVHFLAHGDGGKYQPAFIAYMNALGSGKSREHAWQISFGDTDGFEDRWKTYWTTLGENPTEAQYQKATVATLTSFLARAAAQKQTFESIDDFVRAAAGHTLLSPASDQLPRSLLTAALDDMARRQARGQKFLLAPSQLILASADGRRIIGEFTLARSGKLGRVSVEVVERGR